MAALGVEVPYILYEGHVPPSSREIHVPSEKALPQTCVSGSSWQEMIRPRHWSSFGGKALEKFALHNLPLPVSFNMWSLHSSLSVILALFMKQFLRSKQTLFLFHQEQYSVKRNSRFPRFS